jgi:hypothetical protein
MANTIRACRYIQTVVRQSPLRSAQDVRHDFCEKLGLDIDHITVTYLMRYRPEQYLGLYKRLVDFVQVHKIQNLRVDPPCLVGRYNYTLLANDFVKCQVEGVTLDLRDLRTHLAEYLRHNRAGMTIQQISVSPMGPRIILPLQTKIVINQEAAASFPAVLPDRYLPESQLIYLRRRDADGHKKKLSLELIKDPYSHLEQRKKEIVSALFKVFAKAWEPLVGEKLDEAFFGNYIEDRYFRRAEKLAVLRNGGNEVVGFATMTRLMVNGQPVFYLAGTVMDPTVQGLRLSVKLNKMMIVEAWRQNAHFNGGTITVASRSASARVVGALTSSLDDVFPNPYDRQTKPDAARLELLVQLAQLIEPGIEFDAEKQILRGALTKGVGGLLYQKEDLQPYRDQRVNELCEGELDYGKGDLFLFSGQVSRWTIFRNFFKELSRPLGVWWRGLWLKGFRALSH